MKIIDLFIRLSQASIVIPFIAGILNYNQLNKPFKGLVWFFMFCGLIEIMATQLKTIMGNNMPLLHVFSVIEFCIFAYVFIQYFSFPIKWFYLLVVAFLIIAIIDAVFISTIYKMNSVARNVECIVLIIAALYFYYTNIKANVSHSIYKKPVYWFSTAVIVYFSINFFFFLAMNFLPYNFSMLAIYFHGIINIIANTIFAISFISFKWKT
jgi:hypothetical protein